MDNEEKENLELIESMSLLLRLIIKQLLGILRLCSKSLKTHANIHTRMDDAITSKIESLKMYLIEQIGVGEDALKIVKELNEFFSKYEKEIIQERQDILNTIKKGRKHI